VHFPLLPALPAAPAAPLAPPFVAPPFVAPPLAAPPPLPAAPPSPAVPAPPASSSDEQAPSARQLNHTALVIRLMSPTIVVLPADGKTGAYRAAIHGVRVSMQYEGLRFRAECKLAGRLYGQPFGVDVAFGDPILGEPEVVVAQDVLAFAGIAPPTLRIYPIETHIAEKLHAYTMPRKRPNSRVKDLPDLALLATARTLEATRLRAALEQTFTFRKTHSLPVMLPDPLPAWVTPYAAMAREDRLVWPTLDDVTKAAKAFLDPVLAGDLDAAWSPDTWTWGRPRVR
jgi:hypothetical protein